MDSVFLRRAAALCFALSFFATVAFTLMCVRLGVL